MEGKSYGCENCRVYLSRNALSEELEYYDEKIGGVEAKIAACGIFRTIFGHKSRLIHEQKQQISQRKVIASELDTIETCPGPLQYPLLFRNSATEIDVIIRCGTNPNETSWFSDTK